MATAVAGDRVDLVDLREQALEVGGLVARVADGVEHEWVAGDGQAALECGAFPLPRVVADYCFGPEEPAEEK